jgi:hypothetical protein
MGAQPECDHEWIYGKSSWDFDVTDRGEEISASVPVERRTCARCDAREEREDGGSGTWFPA